VKWFSYLTALKITVLDIRFKCSLYKIWFLSVNSPKLIVVGLVGLVELELPLTVTIRVSRVSAMVSARFSVN